MNEKRARTQRWQFGDTLPECESHKRAYRSHSDAKRALKRIQCARGGLNVRTVYRCTLCGCYHLTHYRKPSPPAKPRMVVA